MAAPIVWTAMYLLELASNLTATAAREQRSTRYLEAASISMCWLINFGDTLGAGTDLLHSQIA